MFPQSAPAAVKFLGATRCNTLQPSATRCNDSGKSSGCCTVVFRALRGAAGRSLPHGGAESRQDLVTGCFKLFMAMTVFMPEVLHSIRARVSSFGW